MGTSISKPYKRVPKRDGRRNLRAPSSALDSKADTIATAQPVPVSYDDDYYDVVGPDAGNLTVFSWITQVTTCCASVCTLIILMFFVIWFIINDSP